MVGLFHYLNGESANLINERLQLDKNRKENNVDVRVQNQSISN